MPNSAATASSTSVTVNDSQPFALAPPSDEYQSRNSATGSTTPETPAIHSPCLTLRRSTGRRVPLRVSGRARSGVSAYARLHARGRERVLEEHRDRHLPDPARHRRDRARLGGHRLELYVALQPVVGAVDAHVEDGHALLHHVAGHHL